MTRPQLALFDLGLQRPHQLVARRIANVIRMTVEHVLKRLDFLAHKLIDPVEFLLELRISFKIPAHDSSSISNEKEICSLGAPTHCVVGTSGLSLKARRFYQRKRPDARERSDWRSGFLARSAGFDLVVNDHLPSQKAQLTGRYGLAMGSRTLRLAKIARTVASIGTRERVLEPGIIR